MKDTYIIPIQYFDLMNERLEKLNRKAKKLNVKPIVVNIINTIMNEVEGMSGPIPSYEVEINQEEEILLNGYKFMGKLEKNVGETYIYKGEDGIPKEKRESVTCEHCNTNRKRKFYYVLKNEETGDFITVGKTCLKDFTGHPSAEQIARFYEEIKLFIEENYEDYFENIFNQEFYPTVYSIDDVIRASIISIKDRGYIKSDSETERPTKVDVEYILRSSYGKTTKADENDYKQAQQIPQEEIDEIKEVILTLEPKTDFIMNLQALIKDGFVKETMLGFAVYIPVAVEREKERKLKEELKNKINEESDYVGVVGEKLITEAYYSRVATFESFYGNRFMTTYIYTFLDKENNCIVWKTQKLQDFTVGDLVQISGKVKEHSEYKGLKQTIITRPKITILENGKK